PRSGSTPAAFRTHLARACVARRGRPPRSRRGSPRERRSAAARRPRLPTRPACRAARRRAAPESLPGKRGQILVERADLVGAQDALEGRHRRVLPTLPYHAIELVVATVVIAQLRQRAARAAAHALGAVTTRARGGKQRATDFARILFLNQNDV